MNYKKENPLKVFLDDVNVSDDRFYELVKNDIIGFNNELFISKLCKISNEPDNFKCLRRVNEKHDVIYKKLYGLDKLESTCYSKKIGEIIKECYKDIDYDFGEYYGCHIWGFSRNIYWCNCLWNVWYIPSMPLI